VAEKQIGIIRRRGVPDRQVNWNKSTGQVRVQYFMNGHQWEWRTCEAKATIANEAFEIAITILGD